MCFSPLWSYVANQNHCLYILHVILNNLEPYLVYPPIFTCEQQPIKKRNVRICAHNLMDNFSLADETYTHAQSLIPLHLYHTRRTITIYLWELSRERCYKNLIKFTQMSYAPVLQYSWRAPTHAHTHTHGKRVGHTSTYFVRNTSNAKINTQRTFLGCLIFLLILILLNVDGSFSK